MDPAYIQQYENFELHHWWFIVRRRIIIDWLNRYVPSQEARWLDVGCGTGVLLDAYKRLRKKVGIEIDQYSVERARSKGLEAYESGTEWDLAKLGKFDVVTMCDVLEHLENEQVALEAVWGALRENGVLLVTVPALPSLWSGHDVVNHHYRRYTRQTLLEVFDRARWEVVRESYFSSLLLPAIWAARKVKNLTRGGAEHGAKHDFKFGVMDRMFGGVFGLEEKILREARLPVGSSMICVARKRP